VHPLVRLAKRTVESYIKRGKVTPPKRLTAEMKPKAGVFVSIHKGGELRGCIGTIEPQRKNIAEEIIANAIASASRDPRFYPITTDELDELEYSVDILTKPEPVRSRKLLLPDLEGVDSVDYQIDICRQKAGIAPEEPVKLYRFEVKRYK
jgi:AmmeMemoRadiSam system protein A